MATVKISSEVKESAREDLKQLAEESFQDNEELGQLLAK